MTNLKQIYTIVILFFTVSTLTFASIEKNEKNIFEVSQGGQLFVDTDKGVITVQTHNSSTIEVEVFLKAKTNDEELAEKIFNYFEIDYDHNGTDLKIIAEFKGEKSWISNLFGSGKSNKLNVKFLITVPEKYNVDLNTSGGGISVGDLDGIVMARTSGGGLNFGNITGDIDGKTSVVELQLVNVTEI